MNTLFDLTEHNILYLKQNEQMLQDYDKYGITFKKDDYSFEINESGVNDTSEAVIIRDLKFTLDSEKIEDGFKLGVATGSASAFSEGLATKDYVYELLEQVK